MGRRCFSTLWNPTCPKTMVFSKVWSLYKQIKRKSLNYKAIELFSDNVASLTTNPMQFLYHQHWNKFFIDTYDVLWKCLEFNFQITCIFHFATLLVSLLCFAGFLRESLLAVHAAKQILFVAITHMLVIETCRFSIRTLLWLAAKIGFDEVPKVGGI